ncbi:hypothetical protein BDW22DRAFT_714164 [Trametopsis cervina]|nr:hypothetical protein BDW22DRAFT_714164 [Trametopsis cervina]
MLRFILQRLGGILASTSLRLRRGAKQSSGRLPGRLSAGTSSELLYRRNIFLYQTQQRLGGLSGVRSRRNRTSENAPPTGGRDGFGRHQPEVISTDVFLSQEQPRSVRHLPGYARCWSQGHGHGEREPVKQLKPWLATSLPAVCIHKVPFIQLLSGVTEEILLFTHTPMGFCIAIKITPQ